MVRVRIRVRGVWTRTRMWVRSRVKDRVMVRVWLGFVSGF